MDGSATVWHTVRQEEDLDARASVPFWDESQALPTLLLCPQAVREGEVSAYLQYGGRNQLSLALKLWELTDKCRDPNYGPEAGVLLRLV